MSQLEHVTQEGLTHFVAFFARAPALFDNATRALREVYLFEASSKRGSNLYSGGRPLSSKREKVRLCLSQVFLQISFRQHTAPVFHASAIAAVA